LQYARWFGERSWAAHRTVQIRGRHDAQPPDYRFLTPPFSPLQRRNELPGFDASVLEWLRRGNFSVPAKKRRRQNPVVSATVSAVILKASKTGSSRLRLRCNAGWDSMGAFKAKESLQPIYLLLKGRLSCWT
jgi:hypothetical protein